MHSFKVLSDSHELDQSTYHHQAAGECSCKADAHLVENQSSGMIVAAIAYALMAFASFGLPMPQTEIGADGNPVAVHVADVTPNLLIMVYLVLTFGELLLSPMGISFVSKVAPPKYKGMMMGGWFVATAIGNQLVVVGGLLWGAVPLWVCWSVFLGVCLVAAIFMFAMMKRLEKVC